MNKWLLFYDDGPRPKQYCTVVVEAATMQDAIQQKPGLAKDLYCCVQDGQEVTSVQTIMHLHPGFFPPKERPTKPMPPIDGKRSLLGRLLDHLAFLFPSSEDATVYNLTVYLEDDGMFIVAADEWHWLPDRLMYPYGTPLFKARLRGDVVFTCRADLVKAVKAILREPQVDQNKEAPDAH